MGKGRKSAFFFPDFSPAALEEKEQVIFFILKGMKPFIRTRLRLNRILKINDPKNHNFNILRLLSKFSSFCCPLEKRIFDFQLISCFYESLPSSTIKMLSEAKKIRKASIYTRGTQRVRQWGRKNFLVRIRKDITEQPNGKYHPFCFGAKEISKNLRLGPKWVNRRQYTGFF